MNQRHSAKSLPPALIDEGRRYFFYDGDDQLTQVVVSNAWMTDFQYNGQRRIRKLVKNCSQQVISDTRFVYDGWNLVAELNSELSLKTSYAWGLDLSGSIQGAGGVGGLLFAVYYSPLTEVYFPAYDGNGNLMALCKGSDCSWAGQYEYGPFGEVIRATGPMAKANPFRFSTKYQDDETGLVYYGYRFYSPSLGRWLSRDPIGEEGGHNHYSFARNKSLNSTDRLGLFTEEERQKVCEDFENEHPPGHATTDPDSVNVRGTVVCKGGTAYPCIFDKNLKKDLRKDVLACFMDHEQSHADDITRLKTCDTCEKHRIIPELKKGQNCHVCPPFVPRIPSKDAIKSECRAYKALFKCLNKFTREVPRPTGWLIGDGLIRDYLRNNPGKCSKEFPEDVIPWDYPSPFNALRIPVTSPNRF